MQTVLPLCTLVLSYPPLRFQLPWCRTPGALKAPDLMFINMFALVGLFQIRLFDWLQSKSTSALFYLNLRPHPEDEVQDSVFKIVGQNVL